MNYERRDRAKLAREADPLDGVTGAKMSFGEFPLGGSWFAERDQV